MKNSKKILAIALAATLTLGMTACGGDSNKSSAEKKTQITAYLAGGDTLDRTEDLVKEFNKQSDKTEVELTLLPDGSTAYQMLTVMYNAGNPPAVFSLESSDISKLSDKLMDLSSLDAVKDAATGTLDDVTIDGKILGVPKSVQGYGLIYSRSVLDDTMGKDFDPTTIKTRDDLKTVFEAISAKGISPVAISPFDWSLANHFLNQVYSGNGKTAEERDAFVASLKEGTVDLTTNAVFNDYMDTFDLMMQYNYYKENPLETVADNVDKQAQVMTSGETAFWFQGNWVSPNIRTLDEDGDYEIIPVPLNDTSSPNYGKLCTLVPGYYCVETSTTTKEQQESSVELINYILNTDSGKQYTVDCGDIPAYTTNNMEIKETLSESIFQAQTKEATFPMYSKYPSDHFDVLGQPMQKYLDGKITRAELADEIEAYWVAAK